MEYQHLAAIFHDRGWLSIEEFFGSAQMDAIERELKRYLSQDGIENIPGHVVYEPGTSRKIRNVFHMHQHDNYFASLAQSPELIELARAIFNDEPILMSVELFGKPAQVGSEVPHHQDNAYFNLTPASALTVWVALADAAAENGCVRYIDGSHKLGNLPHVASRVKGNSMKLPQLPQNAGEEICGIVRRGGALIHHCNTIHRSEPNRSNQDRPGLLFVYKASQARVDPIRAAKYRESAALVS